MPQRRRVGLSRRSYSINAAPASSVQALQSYERRKDTARDLPPSGERAAALSLRCFALMRNRLQTSALSPFEYV